MSIKVGRVNLFVSGCRWRGVCARLSLGAGGVCVWEAAGSLGRGGARALWRRPLHALKASADDDHHTLWLHFSDADTAVCATRYLLFMKRNRSSGVEARGRTRLCLKLFCSG